jgi:hypothetical protein
MLNKPIANATTAVNAVIARDPERFHTEKSCISQDLACLARRFEECPAKPALRVTRQRLRTITTTENIGGRLVRVQRPRAPFAIFVGGNN